MKLTESYNSYFDDSELWIYKSKLYKDYTFVIIDCHDDWAYREISEPNEISLYLLILEEVKRESISSNFAHLLDINVKAKSIKINTDNSKKSFYSSSFQKISLYYLGNFEEVTTYEEQPLRDSIDSIIDKIFA